MASQPYIRWFEDLSSDDVAEVGGKNASLGEMVSNLGSVGVRVPGGFATTAQAYRDLVEASGMEPRLRELLERCDDDEQLPEAAAEIRRLFLEAELPKELEQQIRDAYAELCERNDRKEGDLDVAVRSSATAEDLPEASFAGQQDSFLNVRGADAVLETCRRCFASLFTDRAIVYRKHHGFDHFEVALSVGIQKMVRSDLGSAGVMFSLDTDSGFPRVVLIDAAWGLGEAVVQGSTDPDEYRVFKPLLDDDSLKPIVSKRMGAKDKMVVYAEEGKGEETTELVDTPEEQRRVYVLTDDDVLTLGRWACTVEDHYGMPMDMEWARDGETNELFIVQARPETVQTQRQASALKSYKLGKRGDVLTSGLSVGDAIASGPARVVERPDKAGGFKQGDILVTRLTGPDWVPLMKKAAAVVTDHGGRTSHAAIVCRELGLPAVVGCNDATSVLGDGRTVTVSCAEGDEGFVYDGELPFEVVDIDLDEMGEPPVPLMMNIASPDAAFSWWRLPAHGIGLARMEFIINGVIKAHPLALTRYDELDDETKRAVDELTRGYDDREEYFVDHLSRGIAAIAASQHPNPVIVRTSDFKTNEYADLVGGRHFEPDEENPMLGFRGASRYYSDRYKDGFALECAAIKRAREVIGLDNIVVMIPFVRTLDEADKVLGVLAEHGLERGRDGLQVYMMCEVPSNVILAAEFAQRFDGLSIGSNDLTQLILGVDRDAEDLAELFDERDEAVKRAISSVIAAAHEQGAKVGICGQAPSDHPDVARFLVDEGIDSISLNPDSVIEVSRYLSEGKG